MMTYSENQVFRASGFQSKLLSRLPAKCSNIRMPIPNASLNWQSMPVAENQSVSALPQPCCCVQVLAYDSTHLGQSLRIFSFYDSSFICFAFSQPSFCSAHSKLSEVLEPYFQMSIIPITVKPFPSLRTTTPAPNKEPEQSR